MSFVRDIWADLVEKRLWPVAAALVVALVAIPVLLIQPAAEPKAPPPVMADAGPAPLVTDPANVASARPSGPVVGDAHNPFAQQHVPQKESTGKTSSSGAGPGTTTDAGSGGTGSGPGASPAPAIGGSGPGSSSPRPSRPEAAGPRIKIRFGPTEGRRRVRVLSAGKPLPSAANPAVVFVDVARGGRIEFLVSSDAVPQGDGTCKPTKDICSQLFLRTGDTQFFDVTRSTGKVVQYQLDVLDVIK